jgi:predicted transcriptional regulator
MYILLKYIYQMEIHYKTLETIYTITKDDAQPETYKCRPREIILRQYQEWNVIQQHLSLLEQEGFVITNQEDTLVISITKPGIEKIKSQDISVAK